MGSVALTITNVSPFVETQPQGIPPSPLVVADVEEQVPELIVTAFEKQAAEAIPLSENIGEQTPPPPIQETLVAPEVVDVVSSPDTVQEELVAVAKMPVTTVKKLKVSMAKVPSSKPARSLWIWMVLVALIGLLVLSTASSEANIAVVSVVGMSSIGVFVYSMLKGQEVATKVPSESIPSHGLSLEPA